MTKKIKDLSSLTPEQLQFKLATKQAKEWGFKSITDAKENGYNTKRLSCDMREIRDILRINRDEVNTIVDNWQMNDLVSRVQYADLNCIYFKDTRKRKK